MQPRNSKKVSRIFTICVLASVFCLLMLIYGRIVIESDGISYYALTVSLLRDHDFDLANQVEKMPQVHLVRDSVKPASMYSCGIAILYAPFLWITDCLGFLFPSLSQWKPYLQNEGVPFLDALGMFLASSICSFLTIVIAAKLLVRNYHASFGMAVFLGLMLFVGTSLAFYTFSSPSFSQAADSLLVAAAFYFAFTKPVLGKTWIKNMLTGFFLAFSVMLRNNNIVLILPIVGSILFFERKDGWRRIFLTCLEIFLGALPVLIVHGYFNWTQYDRIFATGYRIDFSDRGLTRKWGAIRNFHAIFTDPGAGMFVWAPITFFAVVGLIVGTFRKRQETIVALLCVVIVIVSMRAMGYAWTGASFGQRFIVHLFIFFVIGICEVTLLWKKSTVFVCAVCCLWSFLLWNAYLINFASPKFRVKLISELRGEMTPLSLLQNTQTAYLEKKNSGTVANFPEFWWNSLGAQPYPSVLHVLLDDAGLEKDKLLKRKLQKMRRQKIAN